MPQVYNWVTPSYLGEVVVGGILFIYNKTYSRNELNKTKYDLGKNYVFL